MEEQVITEQQYKTYKASYGCLMALYVLVIIGAAFSVIGVIGAIAFSATIVITLVSFASMIASLIALHMLLFNKNPERKNAIAGTMLAYALVSAGAGIASLVEGLDNYSFLFTFSNPLFDFSNEFLGKPGYVGVLYILASILYIVTSALFIFMALRLLKKTKDELYGAARYKTIFILLAATMYAYVYLQFFASMPLNNPLGSAIAGGIIMGLAMVLALTPQFVLFKALDDEAYYENFIAVHPDTAIRRYETAKYRPAARPKTARYCMYCGAALMPGANFCRQCGKNISSKTKNIEAE